MLHDDASVTLGGAVVVNSRGRQPSPEARRELAVMDLLIATDAIIEVKRESIRTQIAELRQLESRREQIRLLNASVAA